MKQVVCAFVVVALVLALGSGRFVRADGEGEARRLEIPAPMELAEFLLKVRQELSLPLVWDPKSRALQGKELMGGVVLEGTKDEILAAVRGLIAFYELVLIPVGPPENELMLVMDARQTAAIVKLKPIWVELDDANLARFENQDGLFLTTVIRTKHLGEVGLRDVRNALNRIVTGQNIGNVTEVPSAQGLVVTDFAPNVVAIYRLVRQMDVPAAAAEDDPTRPVVVAVELLHAAAQDAADVLRASFATATAPARTPAAAQAPAPTAPGDLRIAADARTNQVLLHGPAEDVERAKQALALLDQPRPDEKTQVQLLRLEHARAQNVAPLLVQLLHGMFTPVPGRPVPPSRPTVIADTQANALVVASNETMGATLRHLVAELDRDLAAEAEAARTDPQREPPKEPDADHPVRARIETARITYEADGLELPEALALWAEQTGVPLVVTPIARTAIRTNQAGPVRLAVNDRSAAVILQMLVNAGSTIRWTIADGAVVVYGQGERY